MSQQHQFLLYTAPDGAVKVDVFFKDETVWLTRLSQLDPDFGNISPADCGICWRIRRLGADFGV